MTGLRPPALAALVLLAATGAARAQGCGEMGAALAVDPGRAIAGGAGVRHAWGRENVSAGADGSVRVAFPAGSFSPGDKDAPRGGAGFQLAATGPATTRCLRYQVRFPPGFDFAKGGKLPGLYGGDAPRGCSPAELSSGFSARLMWRTGGAGELYLYAPGRAVRCGDSVGRGAWRFVPGAWTAVAQEVTVNAPGQADGRIRIWIDGKPVVDANGLILREQPGVAVDGLIFATFFGGNDPSWASPRDQYAEFRRFEIWTGPPLP